VTGSLASRAARIIRFTVGGRLGQAPVVVQLHGSLVGTSAMEAGIAGHLKTMAELLDSV
jgi:hypothetical protein